MFAVVASILVVIWAVGLSQNLIGDYVNVFFVGAVLALLAHVLGQRRPLEPL